MKTLVGIGVFLAVLLFPHYSWADIALTAGTGKSILTEPEFERFAAVGYQQQIVWDLFVRPEVGGWVDLRGGDRKSSFFGSGLVGLETYSRFSSISSHFCIGPTYITEPDSVLGGHFQFNIEVGLGFEDRHGYVGIAYKHFSSAGIEQPNLGRDMLVLQVRIKGI